MLGALGALALAACGGGGAGGGGTGGGIPTGPTPTPRPTGSVRPTPTPTPTPRHTSTPSPTPTPTGVPTQPPSTGFALVSDDGSAQAAPHGLMLVQIENAGGNLLPSPQATLLPIPSASDIDGLLLNADGSTGAAVDGGNSVYFFTGVAQRRFTLLPATVNVQAYGGDGDSIAGLPNGDEAVVSADGPQLVHIAGILSGNPAIIETIPESEANDGLVISNDGRAMLARDSGGLGIDVYAVSSGSHYAFSLTKHIPNTDPNFVRPLTEDGREGMAFSPADSTRAAIVGWDANGNPVLGLLTGIPNAAVIQSSRRLRMGPPPLRVRPFTIERTEPGGRRTRLSLILGGMDLPYAVSITPNGREAFVGGAGGIVGVNGIDTGSPSQTGPPVYPTVNVGGGQTCVFNSPTTLAVMPDGKYLVAVQACPNLGGPPGNGVLLVFPIEPNGTLGNPAATALNVFAPSDDQMLVH